jgi:hypothetical protein
VTTKIIDWTDALTLIEQAVETRGAEWVYPDTGECRYMYGPEDYEDSDGYLHEPSPQLVQAFGEEKQPACLVGFIFYTLDPRIEQEMWDNNDNSITGWMGDVSDYTIRLGMDEDIIVTHKAILTLQSAQSAQDTGSTWGRALEQAKRRVSDNNWDSESPIITHQP